VSELTATLEQLADAADREPDWPAASWDALRRAGVLRRAVPREYGGDGLGPAESLRGAEALAAACLTTAFVLSQRGAAVRRLLVGPEHLRRRYLPRLAAGEAFLTVGLSQLTTSRQHGGRRCGRRRRPPATAWTATSRGGRAPTGPRRRATASPPPRPRG
jgi:alkylation response protein AidB-like acyl-CoA dehydrogenase